MAKAKTTAVRRPALKAKLVKAGMSQQQATRIANKPSSKKKSK